MDQLQETRRRTSSSWWRARGHLSREREIGKRFSRSSTYGTRDRELISGKKYASKARPCLPKMLRRWIQRRLPASSDASDGFDRLSSWNRAFRSGPEIFHVRRTPDSIRNLSTKSTDEDFLVGPYFRSISSLRSFLVSRVVFLEIIFR